MVGFLNTSFGRSSNTSFFQPVQMDLSVLATPISTSGFGNAFDIAPRAFDTPEVTAPWRNLPDRQPSLSSRAADARNLREFIDLNDATVRTAGNDKDLKATFALYKALQNLQVLAEYAAQPSTSLSALASLDAQFQKGMAEIKAFASASPTEKLELLYGEKQTSLTTVNIKRSNRVYNGEVLQTGLKTEAISGLTGDEVFTVSLKKTGILAGTAEPHTFTIDLSKIEGTLNLQAVVDLINEEIGSLKTEGSENAVFQSKANIFTNKDGDFSLRFESASTEEISIGAPDAQPSAFLIGAQSGTGLEAASGRLVRFDNIQSEAKLGLTQTVEGRDADATALAKAVFDATDAKAPRAEGAPAPVAPGDVSAATRANAVATDSQGFVYVVGATSGDVGEQRNVGGEDVFLSKYAPDGTLVFSRMLGSATDSEGFAVTVDKDDNVIIAGSTSDRLESRDIFSGQDSFVTKYDSAGAEIFTVQLDGVGVDAARAVTTDENGDIFIAGTVSRGTVRSGLTSFGGDDVYIARIDGQPRIIEGLTSRIEEVVQLGTSGKDDIAGITVGQDGRLLIAGTEDGTGVVRALDRTDLSASGHRVTVGDLAGGRISGITTDPDSGAVILTGTTRTGSLAAGPVTGSFNGATDGFVARFDAGLSAQGVTLLGTSGTDEVAGAVVRDGKLYVAGNSNGSLDGAASGTSDAFLARVNLASGAVEDLESAGTAGTGFAASGVALTTATSDTLAKLGLRAGTLTETKANDLIDGTSLRAGDHFYIAKNDGLKRKITIQEGDTVETLSRKISAMYPRELSARTGLALGGQTLNFRVEGQSIFRFTSGADGKDALGKLGLEPTKLMSAAKLFGLSGEDNENANSALTPGGVFALQLSDSFSLSNKKSAEYVSNQVKKSVENIQRAYRSLYYDPLRARLEQQQGRSGGSVPAYLTSQLAGYQEALGRLTNLNASNSSFF